jgi:hypothetical protein
MHDDKEATGKISIDDLFQRKHAQDLKQLSIFNKILNRVHKRIQITSRMKRDRHVWFVIPEYIIGEAVYSNPDCIAFVVAKLGNNGFFVRYFHPNTIFVSWENYVPSYVRTEFKKHTGVAVNEHGQIITDTDSPSAGQGQDQSQAKQKAAYQSIKQYRPSGKFIYDPDIFQKMDETFKDQS